MNLPLFALWVCVVVAFVVLIYFFVGYMQRWIVQSSNSVVSSSGPCTINTGNITDVSTALCCTQGQILTPNRYSPSLNMVVSPTPIPYLTVCQGFCAQGVEANGVTCLNGDGQVAFQTCMELAMPKNCQSLSMPVAHVGPTFYYVQAATDASCPATARTSCA